MSDYIVEILENNSQIDVESSIIQTLELNETDFNLETSLSQTIINTLEIEQSETATIQINTEYVGSVVFASDVIGLDTFIDNFLETAEIDCGSP